MHPSPGTWLDRRGRERAAGPHGPRKRRAAAGALALAATVAGLAACSDEPSATPAANNTAATTTIARPCDDDGVVALLGWDRAELRNQPEVVAVSAGGEARSVSGDWVAPDGAMAADGTVVLVRADGDYESAGPETETLWVRPADGSEPRRLTGGPNDTAPAISPDGEDVAFVQLEWNADALRYRVARVPIDGGEVVGATPWQDDARVVDVAWSPDGERLAYLRWPDDGDSDRSQVELWLVEGDGGAPRRVAIVADGNWVTWGGDTLLVGTRAGEAGTILQVDLADGAVETITDEGTAPALAPDGDGLAYLVYRQERASGNVVGDITIWQLTVGRIVEGRVEAGRDLLRNIGYLYPNVGVSAGTCL